MEKDELKKMAGGIDFIICSIIGNLQLKNEGVAEIVEKVYGEKYTPQPYIDYYLFQEMVLSNPTREHVEMMKNLYDLARESASGYGMYKLLEKLKEYTG